MVKSNGRRNTSVPGPAVAREVLLTQAFSSPLGSRTINSLWWRYADSVLVVTTGCCCDGSWRESR